jgi:vitamin B12 transporter
VKKTIAQQHAIHNSLLHKTFKHKKLICGLLSGLIGSSSAPVFAQSPADNDTFEEMIVTANRYAQTANESLASVSVITREDIEQSAAYDLPELLAGVAGVVVRSSGPYGQQTSLFLRGSNSNHVLVLVDGVKLYSATTGSTALQHIPLTQIERIEVVRGPRSSLYGAEAIGGVIQIFTRHSEQQNSARVELGAGSNSSREVNAGLSLVGDKAQFSVNARHFNTDGIDTIVHDSVNDNDGYRNNAFNAQFDYRFNSAVAFSSSVMDVQGDVDYDNCYNSITFTSSDECSSDYKQQSISNSFKFTPGGIWDGQLQFSRSKDFDENYSDTQRQYTFETEREAVSFTNNFQLSDTQMFALGIDYADDTVSSDFLGTSTPDSRDNTAVFALWNQQLDQLQFNLSVRSDDNEQFDQHTTGNIALGYPLAKNLTGFISYGTAFKAPSFNDLYSAFGGNPDLQPEESASTEIGVRGTIDEASWSFNIYQTDIDDLIVYNQTTFTSENIAQAQIRGAELSSSLQLAQWQLQLALSYTDPRNKSGDDEDKVLQSRPKQTLGIQAQRDFGRFSLGSSLLAQSQRYTSSDNSTSSPGYGLLNAHASYQLSKSMTVQAKLSNLLDKDYILNEGFGTTYSTLGRSLFVNLSYQL